MKRVLPAPLLMLVSEPDPRLPEIAAEAVAGGVNAVRLRGRATPEAAQLAPRIRAAIGKVGKAGEAGEAGGALFIVDDAGLEADGLHLSESASRSGAALGDRLLGRSAHSIEGARLAAAEGADYVLFGSVYRSASHPDREPAGLEMLRLVSAAAGIPVIAIGGLMPETAADCLRAGAAGIAVMSGILGATSPREAAARFGAALSDPAPLTLTVNGRNVVLPRPMTIREFLGARNLREQVVVVEHNREIVPRGRFGDVTLGAKDVVEIVQMMAGG